MVRMTKIAVKLVGLAVVVALVCQPGFAGRERRHYKPPNLRGDDPASLSSQRQADDTYEEQTLDGRPSDSGMYQNEVEETKPSNQVSEDGDFTDIWDDDEASYAPPMLSKQNSHPRTSSEEAARTEPEITSDMYNDRPLYSSPKSMTRSRYSGASNGAGGLGSRTRRTRSREQKPYDSEFEAEKPFGDFWDDSERHRDPQELLSQDEESATMMERDNNYERAPRLSGTAKQRAGFLLRETMQEASDQLHQELMKLMNTETDNALRLSMDDLNRMQDVLSEMKHTNDYVSEALNKLQNRLDASQRRVRMLIQSNS
mmetsp:Transcript_16550/g.35957  ORF Transcript_16550/g.35957 Transcript_16550/m.35957 type:complete len:314 (-) Transcript_16550:103-1044(-)